MQELINAVIEQIKKDIVDGDETAIEELLWYLPAQKLIWYLPEECWGKFNVGENLINLLKNQSRDI